MFYFSCFHFRIPGVRVLADPFPTVFIHHMYRKGQITANSRDILAANTVKVMAKADQDVKCVIIQNPTFAAPLLPRIKAMIPQVKLAFHTRHPADSIREFMGIADFLESSAYFKLGLNWRYLRERFPCPYDIDR
jgi:hypothetical protein